MMCEDLKREICDAAGRRWAHPLLAYPESYRRAFDVGRRAEAERRGWEGLYP